MEFPYFSAGSATPVEVLVMPRKWIPWNDECENCGSDACEVFTVSDDGAYDGDEVRCLDCEQTGYVSADETGCDTVWHDTVLPELTDEERDAMNSYPADAVSHWCKGEIWDGKKWLHDVNDITTWLDKGH